MYLFLNLKAVGDLANTPQGAQQKSVSDAYSQWIIHQLYTVIETISKTIVFTFRIIQRTVNTVITLKVSENYSMLFSQQLNDNNNDKHHQEHITAPEDDLRGCVERERRWSNVCEAVQRWLWQGGQKGNVRGASTRCNGLIALCGMQLYTIVNACERNGGYINTDSAIVNEKVYTILRRMHGT